jgi:hypothetical protein
MISEEELSVTSKIGLEGFFQESGKNSYAYYTYIYSWESIISSQRFAFF